MALHCSVPPVCAWVAGVLMKISSCASRMRVVMSARSRNLPAWMKSQSSPWVMVPSVVPWKSAEAFLIWW